MGVENFVEGLCNVHISTFFFMLFSLWLDFGIVKLDNLARDNIQFSAMCVHSSNAINRETVVKYRLPVVKNRNSPDKKASYSLIPSILFFQNINFFKLQILKTKNKFRVGTKNLGRSGYRKHNIFLFGLTVG